MNLNERISKIIEYSKLSSSEFADEIEAQRSSISHITSGRNKPSLDFLVKVKERFPELEWEWLITGEGEMKKSEIAVETKPNRDYTSLPDLFQLIDDDNFGVTESEDKVQKEIPRDFDKSYQRPDKTILNDSQRLEIKEDKPEIQVTENQENKVKRIVLFYENGKFESFEP